jgi:release factor glutamine methyltransferase
MPNSKELFKELVSKIHLNESRSEVESLVYFILERKFAVSKTDVLAGKEVVLNFNAHELLTQINRGVPVQYVVGEEIFFDRIFKVTTDVLIPRPETEWLVREVIQSCSRSSPVRVIDIGTGSGCIAVTLSLELAQAKVYATDVNEKALIIAKQNADMNKAQVEFIHHNILSEELIVDKMDMIVSNPPYIPQGEEKTMSRNVKDNEPHLALFVPDHDPLLFYRAIAQRGVGILKPGGKIFVEIHERHSTGVKAVFEETGFQNIIVRKDLDSKDRIVSAKIPL